MSFSDLAIDLHNAAVLDRPATKTIPCPRCNGTGVNRGIFFPEQIHTCPRCNGSGFEVRVLVALDPADAAWDDLPCPDEPEGEPDDCPYCSATGEGHYDGTICQPCRGTGKQVGGGWDEDYPEPDR